MTTVFKVVNAYSGVYLSSNTNEKRPKYPLVLEYKTHVTTKPEFGELFAFSSLNAAKRYVGHDQVILECEATGVHPPKFSRCQGSYNEQQARDFWKGKTGDMFLDYHVDPGTVLCASITPLRVVA